MSDDLRYLNEQRIVRTTAANPGWWAVYDNGDEGLWYEPVALWAEIHFGVYTVDPDTRRSSATQWEAGRDGDRDDRDARTILVVGLTQDEGSVYLDGLFENSDGSTSTFARYAYEPLRTAGGSVPRDGESA